ncbi:MAG: helix-turn-helix domain-containing protein [Luteolibacter sp.]
MKTNRKKETAEPTPPSDECVACGSENSYVRALIRTQKNFRGETFTVKHHHWKCSACGVAVLGDTEMDEAMRATIIAYQEAHNLLTATEVYEARNRMKWTQKQLADRSGLGIATIKRLELGGAVQTDANDECLRKVLGTSVNGAFVFMLTEQFGVVREHLTETWNDGWSHDIEVSRQEVALDDCFTNFCLV